MTSCGGGVFSRILGCDLLLALAACTREVASRAVGITNVFDAEEKAAYEGALNPAPSAPIATLAKAAPVTVLSDTYGKDYWACKVRLPTGQTGRVQCGTLDYSLR